MQPETLAVAFGAIAIGSLLKGLTGVGLPVVALPVLSYFLGLPHAIGILIVPIFLTNLLQSVQTRRAWREVSFFGPAVLVGAVGLVAGSWILLWTDPQRLSLGLGLMLLVYIGTRVFTPNFIIPDWAFRRYAPVMGLFGGLAQGATGLCGAVVAPYLQCSALSRQAKIFTISTIFVSFSLVQLVALFALGLFEPYYFVEGLLALVPAIIFMTAGAWLGTRITARVYDRVLLFVLTLVAIGLIEKAL